MCVDATVRECTDRHRGDPGTTHSRVDAHAGLPRGSTSNYFRTRDALLAGVAAWIAEGETRDLAAGLDRPFPTLDAFIDVYSGSSSS